jgi:hypothetical protein
MMMDGKMVDRGSAPVPCPEKSVAYYRHDGSQTTPAFVFWSGEREGVRNEDGYAKISVSITFCNQLEQG